MPSEVYGLIVAALFAILALNAYRDNERLDRAWAHAKGDYDRMIERLTRTPYQDLRGVQMVNAGPMYATTACYSVFSTAGPPLMVGPGMAPVWLGADSGYSHTIMGALGDAR